MNKQTIIKNFSLFSNAGVGEYGTNNIKYIFKDEEYRIKTCIANELLEERGKIYKENYSETNMIIGSIVDDKIVNTIIEEFNKEQPISGTFSPPCQGSSGLNAFKGNPYDFRNQLIKSVFLIFEKVKENNSLQFGYIENVVSYYKEEIPVLYKKYNRPQQGYLINEYIETKDNKLLNYKNFVLSNDIYLLESKFEKGQIYDLKKDNKFGYEYCVGFNIEYKEEYIIEHLKNSENASISSITIEQYIKESLDKYGYGGELKNIRGDEYGAAQIRQRGFYIFYKKDLELSFPKPIFNTIKLSKTKTIYEGKTLLDAFKIKNLIEVYEYTKEKEEELEKGNKRYKIRKNEIFVDNAIEINDASKELIKWKEKEYSKEYLPNLHFYQPFKERYLKWVENTEEGLSAYKNEQRIHRPYKLIKVEMKKVGNFVSFKVVGDNDFVIKEDSVEYFKENKIIDYKLYVTEEMKEIEGYKEWGYNGRQWMLRDIQVRKDLENILISETKKELKKENIDDYRYIFFPIKGFEAATYKRNSLDKPINALTTKMNYGNSNTVHPIFDRTLTPAEVMSAFGLGYILNDKNEYEKSNEYIPPKEIENIKTFQNLIYEIMGEAIISTVAETILKDLLKQYLKNK